MFEKKKGFTLAEVIVALSLIGVISVLTVPSLMTNTNVKKKAMAYKKAQMVLNDAFVNGNSDGTMVKDLDTLLDKMTPYMAVKYYYGMDASGKKLELKTSDGVETKTAETTSNWIVSNDGIAYKFTQVTDQDKCTNEKKVLNVNVAASGTEKSMSCYEVEVDIDGPKKGDNVAAIVTLSGTKLASISGDRFKFWISYDGVATGNPNVIEGAKLLEAEE